MRQESNVDIGAINLVGHNTSRRVVITVMLSMTLGVMPFFLLGAFSPEIQANLGLSEVGFGAIVAGYFAVSVIFSMSAGHVGEVRGAEAPFRDFGSDGGQGAAELYGAGRIAEGHRGRVRLQECLFFLPFRRPALHEGKMLIEEKAAGDVLQEICCPHASVQVPMVFKDLV